MLGLQQVSIEDDFFELGGVADRNAAFQPNSQRVWVELPLSVLSRYLTIAATAALLREAKGMAGIVIGGRRRLTHASERRRPIGDGARRQPANITNLHCGAVSFQRSDGASVVGRDHTGGNRPPLFCVHGRGQRAQLPRSLVGPAP
jgi:hypothetical protein